MARHYVVSVLALVAMAATTYAATETRINRAWAGGMQSIIDVPIANNVTGGWHLSIDFPHNVFQLDASCWADVAEMHAFEGEEKDRSMVVLKNPEHAPDLLEGTNLRFYFLAKTWKRRKGFTGTVNFVPSAYVGPMNMMLPE